jgi:hypothetical protein
VSEAGKPGDSAPAESTDDKVVTYYPPPPEDPPEPTFRQYATGWGIIFLSLVVFGVVIGLLMKFLR